MPNAKVKTRISLRSVNNKYFSPNEIKSFDFEVYTWTLIAEYFTKNFT